MKREEMILKNELIAIGINQDTKFIKFSDMRNILKKYDLDKIKKDLKDYLEDITNSINCVQIIQTNDGLVIKKDALYLPVKIKPGVYKTPLDMVDDNTTITEDMFLSLINDDLPYTNHVIKQRLMSQYLKSKHDKNDFVKLNSSSEEDCITLCDECKQIIGECDVEYVMIKNYLSKWQSAKTEEGVVFKSKNEYLRYIESYCIEDKNQLDKTLLISKEMSSRLCDDCFKKLTS